MASSGCGEQRVAVMKATLPDDLDTCSVGDFLGIPSRQVKYDAEASDAAQWAYSLASSGQGLALLEARLSCATPYVYDRGAIVREASMQVPSAPHGAATTSMFASAKRIAR